jgi:phosphopantothenoylcysteine decarboxylase/phosphopantothenate--cysteine ligase
VRFISNRSSGKMGYAVARAARRRGAAVVLISGPTSLEAPPGVELIPVTTAAEMREAVLRREPWASVVVMTAAVADYRAANPARHKIKKGDRTLSLSLEQTNDILAEVGARHRAGRLLVGFAAETEHGIEHARRKLREKRLDLIVLNDVSQADAGFDVDTNRVWLIGAEGEAKVAAVDKEEVAALQWNGRGTQTEPRSGDTARRSALEPRLRRPWLGQPTSRQACSNAARNRR